MASTFMYSATILGRVLVSGWGSLSGLAPEQAQASWCPSQPALRFMLLAAAHLLPSNDFSLSAQ
ncbi:hypothetical protein LZC95_07905 [Pendulispora brunnea]|uniref:Uncharacterized protein n=1 Tax=Pendulispora brunnea TaxID=2905690 RepID=A0ABZ2KIJ7_9BACT